MPVPVQNARSMARWNVFAGLALAMSLVACGGSGDSGGSIGVGGRGGAGGETLLEIEPYRELCSGDSSELCYLVRRQGVEGLERVRGAIEGFRHAWGVRAKIRATSVTLADGRSGWRQVEALVQSRATPLEAHFVRLSVAVMRETEPCIFLVRSEAALHVPDGGLCRSLRVWLREGREFIAELEFDFNQTYPMRILTISAGDGQHSDFGVSRGRE
ncbi:MAG: hypothetical protein NDI61_14125 [Bdellovibrionaceae bacterium]|nr:hypothetical protein [Pseudobdellovibrionaceae bacterium]